MAGRWRANFPSFRLAVTLVSGDLRTPKPPHVSGDLRTPKLPHVSGDLRTPKLPHVSGDLRTPKPPQGTLSAPC
jgi:hypothetical protein